MLNRNKSYETVAGFRNWKYTQDGKLFNVNGQECSADGKTVGKEVATPTPVEPAPGVMTIGKVETPSETDPITDPQEMSDGELKEELKSKGHSIKGGLNRATLIARVVASRVEN